MGPKERQHLHLLMTRLADGNREAFDPLFELLWPLLRRFVAHQLPSAEADDVAQQALLRIFERASQFDHDLDALSWALGIAAYELRSARRRSYRRREDAEPTVEERHDPRPSPEDVAIAEDLRRAVAELSGTLRPGDLETLRALARGERPAGATFRKRLERALCRFRLAWRTKHGPR